MRKHNYVVGYDMERAFIWNATSCPILPMTFTQAKKEQKSFDPGYVSIYRLVKVKDKAKGK